jgi:hypothetical protein
VSEYFLFAKKYPSNAFAEFNLIESSEPDTYIRQNDGSKWRVVPYFTVSYRENSGFHRVPLPCFDELISITMESSDYDDKHGAASVLLDDDHADQLLDRCLEMLDSNDPEQYYDFFQTLQLGKPENTSPTAGKKYVQIAEDHRKWDIVSEKVAAMEAARPKKSLFGLFIRGLFKWRT